MKFYRSGITQPNLRLYNFRSYLIHDPRDNAQTGTASQVMRQEFRETVITKRLTVSNASLATAKGAFLLTLFRLILYLMSVRRVA